MKTISKILLLLLIIMNGRAAAQQPILAMYVVTTAPAGDTTQLGSPALDSLTQFSTLMTVFLNGDTGNIYRLHVKLGNSLHGSQYLSAFFDYGQSGNFGTLSYYQSGLTIQMGLGSHPLLNYNAEVQVERTDNTFEDAVIFSNY